MSEALAHGGLDAGLRTTIQEAYRAWLAARAFTPRRGQRLMIAEIARTLAGEGGDDTGRICVVEAGTGTGKTVAYGLAAIPVAQALNLKLVISTATVALQDQLVDRDLPDLAEHAGLHFTYALAKGRGRYACPSRLDRYLVDDSAAVPGELFEQAAPVGVAARALYRDMLDDLRRGAWDGDREGWQRAVDDGVWSGATMDHRGCSGPRCSFFRDCPYYLARERIGQADVIVANHDLVLSDLALGGGVVLPEPESTIYVFDEGHHLADKALGHLRRFTRILSGVQTLDAVDKLLGTLAQRTGRDHTLVDAALRVATTAEPLRQHLRTMLELGEALADIATPPRGFEGRSGARPSHRFAHGEVPAAMVELAGELAGGHREIGAALDIVLDRLATLGDDDRGERDAFQVWTEGLSQHAGRIEGALALWEDFAAPGEGVQARWVSRVDHEQSFDLEFQSSPLQAGASLSEALWEACHGAVVTSATLTSTDGFRRFAEGVGVPEDTRYLVAPSSLPYEQAAELVVPAMKSDPGRSDDHNAEIASMLPDLVDPKEGTLVIFTSWRQLSAVTESLPPAFLDRVLSQADLTKARILKQHRECIDAGRGSVIFGLASFAEGVDLAGDHCRHVIITKLPFAVPDDPVEAAVAEWLESQGRNPFMEVSVPDAALRLKQACGRLLRSESDTGKVTLLDRRIVTRRYGRAILDSLPPFRRNIAR
ncbi:MAG: ATP-dependent DNA helicase DinG [Gammaproteobacteria bacterium]|nr:ATP-dependent DNA helicase DinG [Gammaproteobacteria bacterium]